MDRNVRLVEQKQLAVGATVYGQQIVVTEDHYSGNLPGLGDTAFSVSVTGTRDHAPFTAGFTSIEDAKRFLHGTGEDRFTGYTHSGNEYEETRLCLGVPKGMMSEFGDPPVIHVGNGDSVDYVLSNTDPGANQVSRPLVDGSDDPELIDSGTDNTPATSVAKDNVTPPSSGGKSATTVPAKSDKK